MDNSIIGSMLVLLTIITLMVRGLWQASRERSYKVSRDGKRITLSRRALETLRQKSKSTKNALVSMS